MSVRKIRFHGAVLRVEDGQVVGVDPSEKQPAIDMALSLFDAMDRVLVAGGGMCWVAARIGGVARSVLVYEANPTLAALAQTNVTVEGIPFDVVSAAIGASERHVALHVNDYWPESQVANLEGIKETAVTSLVQVRQHDISQIIKLAEINALALDIEGAEHSLLLGMSDFALSKISKILLELHTSKLEDEGAAVLKRLHEAGFIETRSAVYFTRVSLQDHRPTKQIRGIYKTFIHESKLEPLPQ